MSDSEDDAASGAHQQAVEGMGDATDDDAFDASDEEGGNTRGGGRYLTDLAEVLEGAGLDVKEYDGWQRRARGSGGLGTGPLAIIVHHTASPLRANGQRDADYIAKQDKNAPISNLYLDRQGTWWVIAAGATNTNGKGGPWGPVAANRANQGVIGIEAGNNGTGEPWPRAQQDSYVRGVAALADKYNIDTDNILSHAEWSPSRKIDPAGPSRFGSVNRLKTWDMDIFRKAVDDDRKQSGSWSAKKSSADAPGGSGQAGASDKYVVKAGDTWWSIADRIMGDPGGNWESLAKANGGADSLLAGAVLTIPGGARSGTASAAAQTMEFPGEAKAGMTGAVVVTWQQALIDHGVIADSTGNRDGEYGAGMERAVRELQESWDWTDADGIAGPGTWKRLQAS